MITNTPSSQGIIARLCAISEMIVESFNRKSKFVQWLPTSSYAPTLHNFSTTLIFHLNHIGSKGTNYSPPISVELQTAFINAATTPVYLEALLSQARYVHILQHYKEHISFLEEVYRAYQGSKFITPAYDHLRSSSSSAPPLDTPNDPNYLATLFEMPDSFHEIAAEDNAKGTQTQRLKYLHALVDLSQHHYYAFNALLNSLSCEALEELSAFLSDQIQNNYRAELTNLPDYQEFIHEIAFIQDFRAQLSLVEIDNSRQKNLSSGYDYFQNLTTKARLT